MTEFGNWIKNADTKVTILAAALGILITANASKSDVYRQALSNPEFHCKWTLIVVMILLLAAMLDTAVYVYRALSPRTGSSIDNRFAWPSVAAAEHAPTNLDRRTTVEDAWQQNYILAKIAKQKYAAFGSALRGFSVALILSGAAMGIATWNAAGPIP